MRKSISVYPFESFLKSLMITTGQKYNLTKKKEEKNAFSSHGVLERMKERSPKRIERSLIRISVLEPRREFSTIRHYSVQMSRSHQTVHCRWPWISKFSLKRRVDVTISRLDCVKLNQLSKEDRYLKVNYLWLFYGPDWNSNSIVLVFRQCMIFAYRCENSPNNWTARLAT